MQNIQSLGELGGFFSRLKRRIRRISRKTWKVIKRFHPLSIAYRSLRRLGVPRRLFGTFKRFVKGALQGRLRLPPYLSTALQYASLLPVPGAQYLSLANNYINRFKTFTKLAKRVRNRGLKNFYTAQAAKYFSRYVKVKGRAIRAARLIHARRRRRVVFRRGRPLSNRQRVIRHYRRYGTKRLPARGTGRVIASLRNRIRIYHSRWIRAIREARRNKRYRYLYLRLRSSMRRLSYLVRKYRAAYNRQKAINRKLAGKLYRNMLIALAYLKYLKAINNRLGLYLNQKFIEGSK